MHARRRAQPTDTNRPQACRYTLRTTIAKPPSGHVALPETFDCFPGGHGEDETPVPIPNTEVKGLIGEGTAGFARGRVARRRDFSPKGAEQPLGPLLFLPCRAMAKSGAQAAIEAGCSGKSEAGALTKCRNGGAR